MAFRFRWSKVQETGVWIPAFAGMTDGEAEMTDHKAEDYLNWNAIPTNEPRSSFDKLRTNGVPAVIPDPPCLGGPAGIPD